LDKGRFPVVARLPRLIPRSFPVRRIAKTKVKDQVLEALEDMIVRGRFAPGDRLPSEGDLAETFGVGSRSILEARGIVEGMRAATQRDDIDQYNALDRDFRIQDGI